MPPTPDPPRYHTTFPNLSKSLSALCVAGTACLASCDGRGQGVEPNKVTAKRLGYLNIYSLYALNSVSNFVVCTRPLPLYWDRKASIKVIVYIEKII